ncbi:hypothetical protein GCM10022255_085890 [Dactylosporangium darangshiense]|uniref:Uncharacterized protein n=1 Tax=Dactylosporangium darangshiense TaxID=579108 RepID=A0ABP8DMS4_9ACTN
MTAPIAHPGRRAGLRRLLTVLVGVILAVAVGAGRAAAEPSPAPSPPVPSTPHPTGSPTTPAPPAPSETDIPGCGGTVPGTVQRWCFLWVRYTTSPPAGAPSHWITACAQGLTNEQLQQCQTVALTLDDRPGDGTPTVLSDVAPGIPSAPELVRCELFAERGAADPGNANRWNYKRDQCRIWAATLSHQLRDPGDGSTPPSTPPSDGDSDCGLTDVSCQVQNILNNAISNGIQGLVNMTVKCMAWLLGEVAKAVFDVTAPPKPDEAFYFTYNSTASILLLFVLLFFIITVIINGLRVNGPGPLATLGGLVRAMLGILFAGGLAWIIVAAWDEATTSLINANSNQRWDAALWVKAVSTLSVGGGTALLALLIAGLSIIGLLLLLITQLFRSELAEGAALLGAFAMTGQVAPETKHWARRWFWTLNALGMSRFVTVELWIYGTRSAYESDLITAGKGLLIIWMMVMTPWVLLRLLTIVDGYLSDINARGVMAAFGAQAAQAAGDAPGSPSSGSPGEQAAQLMNGNLADLPGEQHSPGNVASESGRGGVGKAEPQRELTDGPKAQGADAVSGAGDGTAAGDPHGAGGPASGGSEGGPDAGGADHPNADEAAGVQQHSQQAKADLNAATTTATGGSSAGVPPGGTGAGNGQPSGTSGTAADDGDPAPSTGSGGGDGGGAASGMAGSTDADPLIAAAGAEHHQYAESMSPSGSVQPLDTFIPGAEHGGGSGEPGGAGDSPPGGEPPTPPTGGAGSGGGGAAGGGAAAGAAEVPIIPV